jgi:hypothetical protein
MHTVSHAVLQVSRKRAHKNVDASGAVSHAQQQVSLPLTTAAHWCVLQARAD